MTRTKRMRVCSFLFILWRPPFEETGNLLADAHDYKIVTIVKKQTEQAEQ